MSKFGNIHKIILLNVFQDMFEGNNEEATAFLEQKLKKQVVYETCCLEKQIYCILTFCNALL